MFQARVGAACRTSSLTQSRIGSSSVAAAYTVRPQHSAQIYMRPTHMWNASLPSHTLYRTLIIPSIPNIIRRIPRRWSEVPPEQIRAARGEGKGEGEADTKKKVIPKRLMKYMKDLKESDLSILTNRFEPELLKATRDPRAFGPFYLPRHKEKGKRRIRGHTKPSKEQLQAWKEEKEEEHTAFVQRVKDMMARRRSSTLKRDMARLDRFPQGMLKGRAFVPRYVIRARERRLTFLTARRRRLGLPLDRSAAGAELFDFTGLEGDDVTEEEQKAEEQQTKATLDAKHPNTWRDQLKVKVQLKQRMDAEFQRKFEQEKQQLAQMTKEERRKFSKERKQQQEQAEAVDLLENPDKPAKSKRKEFMMSREEVKSIILDYADSTLTETAQKLGVKSPLYLISGFKDADKYKDQGGQPIPLIMEQLHTERLAVEETALEYKKQMEHMKDLHKQHTLGPAQRVFLEWYPFVLDGIQKLCADERIYEKDGIGPFLAAITPPELSVLTMHTLFGLVLHQPEGIKFTFACVELGRAVEAECKLAWGKQQKKAVKAERQKHAALQAAIAKARAAGTTVSLPSPESISSPELLSDQTTPAAAAAAAAKFASRLPMSSWTQELHVAVGATLLDLFLKTAALPKELEGTPTDAAVGTDERPTTEVGSNVTADDNAAAAGIPVPTPLSPPVHIIPADAPPSARAVPGTHEHLKPRMMKKHLDARTGTIGLGVTTTAGEEGEVVVEHDADEEEEEDLDEDHLERMLNANLEESSELAAEPQEPDAREQEMFAVPPELQQHGVPGASVTSAVNPSPAPSTTPSKKKKSKRRGGTSAIATTSAVSSPGAQAQAVASNTPEDTGAYTSRVGRGSSERKRKMVPPITHTLDLPGNRRHGDGKSFIPALYHFYQATPMQFGSPHKVIGMIKADRRLIALVSGDGDSLHSVLPKFNPMVIRPRNWTAWDKGGYLSVQHKIVRTSGSGSSGSPQLEAVRQANLDRIFEGVNFLASTPWKIHPKVHDTMQYLWSLGGGIADLPLARDTPVPKLTRNSDPAEVKRVEEIQKANAEQHSQRCEMRYRFAAAEEYLGRRIYYPYFLDFRGRAYPIPPYLNHTGSDISRGLLQFAEPKPLGERGLYWLLVHTATLYGGGVDKQSYDARMEWTQRNIDNIVKSVEHPNDRGAWWLTADKPFQFLAAIHEVYNCLRWKGEGGPTSFPSTLPTHTDGSCNGLQHYAALGRDLWGGTCVNLVAGEKPQDVYARVLDTVLVKLQKDSETPGNKNEKIARDLLSLKLTRKVVKQAVMTSVYGVTLIGARDQVQARLEEIPRAVELFDGNDGRPKMPTVSMYLANVTLHSLYDAFAGARRIQNWLGDCATRMSMVQQPVSWITPLGLPVIQPYRAIQQHIVNTTMQSVTLTSESENLPVSSTRQKSAFPPNFIHSLDATHMLMTAGSCREKGLTFAAVHDSYWTHAGSMDELSVSLREQFVNLYERPILEQTRDNWIRRYPEITFASVPKRGELDIKEVLKSPYFFN